MKKFIAMLATAAFAFGFSAADFKQELNEAIGQIKQVLNEEKTNKSEELYAILHSHLDVQMIPRLALGKYFAQAPAEFNDLFFKHLKKDLAAKIDLVDANSLELVSFSQDAKRCKASMSVNYEDGKKQIDFLFRKVDDECKLYDITILDTSLIASYRSQFIDIITQDGMSALINKLK